MPSWWPRVPARHRIPAGAGAVAWAGVVEGHGTGRLERPTIHREDRMVEPTQYLNAKRAIFIES
jgi:hypothetical protein